MAIIEVPGIAECFAPVEALRGPVNIVDPLSFDLQCRMPLSCLVDADRLDTAASVTDRDIYR